eukprot:89243_1
MSCTHVMKEISVSECMLMDAYITQLGKLFMKIPEAVLCLLHLFHHIPEELIVEVQSNNYTDEHIGYGRVKIDPKDTNYNTYQWLVIAPNCPPDINNDISICSIVLGVTATAVGWEPQTPWYFNTDNKRHFNFTTDCWLLDEKHYNNTHRFRKIVLKNDNVLLLELNTEQRTFAAYINNEKMAILKHIPMNVSQYHLGCYMKGATVSLKMFAKFKRTNQHPMHSSDLRYKYIG